MPHTITTNRSKYIAGAVVVAALFCTCFFRTAWISEDAFITFRVVENTINGFGLVWNPGERVQTYTHPLWFLILIPTSWATGDPYWSAMGLSFAALLATLAVATRIRNDWPWYAILGLCSLLFSRAFFDYSSSGLENPLVHLLLSGFLVFWLKGSDQHKPFVLSLLASLLFLTRPDAIVLVAIPLLHELLRSRRLLPMIAGAVPAFAWIAFSLFYYGAPVPNTALAKVETGSTLSQNIAQAISYLLWSVDHDLATMFIIVFGTTIGLFSPRLRWFSLGILAWVAYLFYIGADYMGGRFLSAPTLLSALLLVAGLNKASGVALAVALFISFPSLRFTIASPDNFSSQEIPTSGIADERGFYYPFNGLVPALKNGTWQLHPWLHEGFALRSKPGLYARCTIGMAAYAAGPNVQWIDPLALADPMLSRLPSRSGSRVGHYERALPNGYLSSLLLQHNLIQDPSLHELYEDVLAASRAPLISKGRLGAIVRLNTGHHANAARDFDRNAIGLPGVPIQTRSVTSCFGLPYGGDGVWLIEGDPPSAARVKFILVTD